MKSLLHSLAIIIALVFNSCSGEKGTNTITSPQITKINLSSAIIGEIISISGMNFGFTQGTGFVSFTGANATDYSSWNNTEIKVKVPKEAISGKIHVTVNGMNSNEVDFIVTFSCIGRNTYSSITIGSQIWMVENLDVCFYRNGDPIPQVSNSAQWANLTSGAWCNYNNDTALGAIYGKLYNWYAINDPRGLEPDGWHIPSYAEWTTLSNYLGGESDAGGKMKESGIDHWKIPNSGATNSSGFTALPGGYRDSVGIFYELGTSGYWCCKQKTSPVCFGVSYDSSRIYQGYDNMLSGNSIRCIKN